MNEYTLPSASALFDHSSGLYRSALTPLHACTALSPFLLYTARAGALALNMHLPPLPPFDLSESYGLAQETYEAGFRESARIFFEREERKVK